MIDIIGGIIIGVVVLFVLWRIVTARYRTGRKMLEHQQQEEEELHVLSEWAKRDSIGKPYNLKVVRRDEPPPEQKDDENAGTTKNQ